MVKAKDYKVYTLKCECGKVIVSLSEAQADYNMKVHKINCKGNKQ